MHVYFGSVVDRESDSLIESFVVHLLSVDQLRRDCNGKHPLLVSSLSNVPN
jgi:acid phosphatase class B